MLTPLAARLIATPIIVTGGLISVPLATRLVEKRPDHVRDIHLVHLAGMSAFGAAVGTLLPGIAGHASSRLAGAALGSGLGLASAVVGVLALRSIAERSVD